MGFEEEGEAGFGDLDAAEFNAAGRVPLADRGPAVAGDRTAAARAGLEHVPDETATPFGVLAGDGDAQPAAPTTHHAIRAGGRESDDDRLNDLVGAVAGAHGHRRALIRPDDRAGLRHDVERPEGAVIPCLVGVEQEGEGHGDGRLHVSVGGVDEAGGLGIGAGQVDRHVAAGHCALRVDADVVATKTVIVEEGFSFIHAVRPVGDDGAGATFGRVEHGLHRLEQRGGTDLGDDSEKARFAKASGADLRCEVATEVPRMAHVQRQHLQQVFPKHAVLGQANRRDAKTFLPDFRGGRVVGAMRGAADIAVMGADDRPEKQAITGEDRDEDGQVRQMAAAAIGVVEQVDGLGLGIGHSLHQCLGGP